ncbi:MAG: hypothetical protein WCD69_25090 [Xanthobacteraceae bacterium]
MKLAASLPFQTTKRSLCRGVALGDEGNAAIRSPALAALLSEVLEVPIAQGLASITAKICGTSSLFDDYLPESGCAFPKDRVGPDPLAGIVAASTTRTMPVGDTARMGDEGKPPVPSSGPAACCLNFRTEQKWILVLSVTVAVAGQA